MLPVAGCVAGVIIMHSMEKNSLNLCAALNVSLGCLAGRVQFPATFARPLDGNLAFLKMADNQPTNTGWMNSVEQCMIGVP